MLEGNDASQLLKELNLPAEELSNTPEFSGFRYVGKKAGIGDAYEYMGIMYADHVRLDIKSKPVPLVGESKKVLSCNGDPLKLILEKIYITTEKKSERHNGGSSKSEEGKPSIILKATGKVKFAKLIFKISK